MSRFGETATFFYAPGDSLAAGTTLVLGLNSMPTYPFESHVASDRSSYTARTGKIWTYQNYDMRAYTLNWANLVEADRNKLKRMYDALPILTFASNGTVWGTFRMSGNTWTDQETAFELYDLSFEITETP